MRSIAKAVERLRQMPGLTKVLSESRGLINTTDLLVATAATVILAAGVGGAAIGTLDSAKYAKAQPDAQAVANAISGFFKDTGKWPGQADHAFTSGAAGNRKAVFLVSYGGVVADISTTAPVPTAFTTTTIFAVSLAACAGNSLEGFVNISIDGGSVTSNTTTGGATTTGATLLNINDYLVRKPNDAKYPNWKGPYLQADISTDPWDKSWVINLMPLYCAETVTDSNTWQGLGYAWVLSGGSNRTLTTAFISAKLDTAGDDAGLVLGKLVKRGTGGLDR